MPGLRLLLLGIAAGVVVLLLVAGSAYQVLRESFRALRDAQAREAGNDDRPVQVKRPQERKKTPARYTPERTRLRWYSPEIVAVLLLCLALGLWLAKLAG